MTNKINDDRERLLSGDWIVYNVVEGENFDLTGSKIAILTEKQWEKLYYNNIEPERIPDLETYDLYTLVEWAINHGFLQGRPRCSPDDPQRAVFVVSFPLLEHPGQTLAVVLDRGEEMRGDDEEDAKEDVISEFEDCDLKETDYPEDLDIDEDHVTCRRMTAAEAEEATKSSVNACWWR
jgi:hypothetical protein